MARKKMSNDHMNSPEHNSNNQTIKSLLIVGGEKGGTGKSYVCKHLVGYLIRRTTPENRWDEKIMVYDADPSVDDVYQVYKDYPWMKRLEFSDDKYKIPENFNIIETHRQPLVIINLPSNIQKNFNNFFEQFGFFKEEVKNEFYETAYFFFISDGSFQSVKLFLEHLERYQSKSFIKTILVLNEGQNGHSDSFNYLETVNSEKARQLLREIQSQKIPILHFPELIPFLRFQIEDWMSSEKISFDDLINRPEKLTIGWRSNLKVYIDEINKVFDSIIADPETIKYTELVERLTYSDNKLPVLL